MSLGAEFYDTYHFPEVPKQISLPVRRKLLDLIEVPEEYAENPSEDAVRILINTTVLGSQGQRGVKKIAIDESRRNGLREICAKFSFAAKKQKKSSESPPELERLTVSEKKLQRNAKAAGIQTSRKFSAPIKLNSSFGSYETCQSMLLHNMRVKRAAEEKEKRRKAVKFLIGIGERRREILRGKDWKPATRKLSAAYIRRDENSEVLSEQLPRKISDRSTNSIENKDTLSSLQSTARLSKKEAKKKVRRHTVATTEGISNFIGALEQLALAPINPSV